MEHQSARIMDAAVPSLIMQRWVQFELLPDLGFEFELTPKLERAERIWVEKSPSL